ncbi:MAG TPA: phenylalanine--tRNA ligase beta subunit-related protein [Clostridia bacterium]|nr:phenylalanine--tRNA ligase beta subunit-related protein [Clostridia bacterium]
MRLKVDPQIFKKFPGVRIAVLKLQGIDNSKSQDKIAMLLREEEKRQNRLLQTVEFGVFPETASWRAVYEAFGSKPSDFRSSVEALLRRVKASKPLPSINPLVDLYNYISIRFYLPAGAEDLDKVVGDIELTFAKGNEKGRYIGSEREESCYPGEVIYKDAQGFICRRWNWREGERTKIERKTKNAILVLEALPAVTEEKLRKALEQTENLVKGFLGGKIKSKILMLKEPILEL